MADNFSDIKKTNVEVFLSTYSKRLEEILDNNPKVSFSVFEIMLPIILDNYSYLMNNTKTFRSDKKKSASTSIESWLSNHGFIDNSTAVTKVTNKPITIEDMINFASEYCNALSTSGLITNSSSGYNSINSTFFAQKQSLPEVFDESGEQKQMSFNDCIKSLQNNNTIYPANVDKVLRNLSAGGKFNQTDKRHVTIDNKKISAGDYIIDMLTHFWNQMVDKPKVVAELKKYLPNYNWSDSNNMYATDFYTNVKLAYRDNKSLQNSELIKNVVQNCNPSSLLFLLQKVENTATKNYKPRLSRLGDTAVFANTLNKVQDVIKSIRLVINEFELSPKKNIEKIYNDKKRKFVIPLPLEPVNTSQYKDLLLGNGFGGNSITLEDMKKLLNSKVDGMNRSQLYSLYSNLNNDDVIEYLNKYLTLLLVQHEFESEPYNLKFKKDGNDIVFTDETDYFIDAKNKLMKLIQDCKAFIFIHNYVINNIVNGTYNYSSLLDKLKDTKAIELYERGYIFTFIDKLDYLKKYSENNNYDLNSINYNSIVNSNSIDNFVLNPKLILTCSITTVEDDQADLLKKLQISDRQINKIPTKEEFDNIYSTYEPEVGSLINEIQDKVREKLEVAQDTPLIVPDKSLTRLKMFQSALNNKYFVRHAVYQFNDNDLEEFLNNLYKESGKDQKNVVSKYKQTLLTSLADINQSANNIIEFLNLKGKNLSVKEIGSYIDQLKAIVKDSKYAILFNNIDLDFIEQNSVSIINCIYNKLLSKKTQLNYHDVLAELLKLNTNISDNKYLNEISILFGDSKLEEFIKQQKINVFDASKINEKLLPEPYTLNGLIAYISNVLFRTYIANLEQLKDTALQEYTYNQKFNLLMDVCNSLSKNKTAFTDKIVNVIKEKTSKDYLLNAKNKFYNLSEVSLYKNVPHRVLQMIANYKVLSNIRGMIFSTVMNDPVLSILFRDCTDWEFSDELISSILNDAQIYDISGKLMPGNIKKLKSNITLPFDYNFSNDSSFESKLEKISNKLKGLNGVSLNRNILALYKIIKLVEPELRSLQFNVDKILKELDKLDETPILIKEKTDLEKKLTKLKNNLKNILTTTKDNITKYKPNLEKIITDWQNKNPELSVYTKITPNYDNKRGIYTGEFNVLPVNIKLDVIALESLVNNDTLKEEISTYDADLRNLSSLINQHMRNAIIKSTSSPTILLGLNSLKEKAEYLIKDLSTKIQNKFGNNFITVSDAETEIGKLKEKLFNFVLDIRESTNTAIQYAQNTEGYVTDLWEKYESLKEKYNLEKI